jgi:hypothetical protein
MKHLSTIFLVVLIARLSTELKAEIIPTGSCHQDSVQAAIDRAADGDTVQVTAGTGIWTASVTIGKHLTWGANPTFESKQITLLGAGIDSTTIVSSSSYGGILLDIIGVEGKPIRITGFTFKGMQRLSTTWPAINLSARIWRIDHCKFDGSDITPWQQGRGVIVSGQGIIDHCNFLNSYQSIAIIGDDDASWNRSLTPGTSDAVYIEDCTVTDTEPFDGANDAYGGARYVFRHNSVKNEIIGNHGRDTGGYRSALWFEYYDNIFTSTLVNDIWVAANFRGGTGVMFHNNWNGKYRGDIRVVYYCAIPGNPSCGWSQCITYPCMDQTGRGPDMDNDGVQDLVPLYEWNNTKNGADIGIEVESNSAFFIQDGRDYYGDTYNPKYIPYPYPHPQTLSDYPNQQRSLNLEASQLSDQVHLTWSAVTGADHYRILRNWQEAESSVTGLSWSENISSGEKVYMVYAIGNSDGKIFAAEGVLVNPASFVTPISGLPSSFSLYQNFPNPFNPSTTISFYVGTYGYTSLKVYDILGREIVTLVHEQKPAGTYNVFWDGRDTQGKTVSSGVYFYSVEHSGQRIAKQMVLIK